MGKSDAGAVVAIENAERKIFGLQYHPEVTHSERGFETIRHFLFHIAKVEAGWTMQNVLDEQIAIVNQKVGPDDHVICALSGGVDSAVAATLVHKAIGDKLHCCFVDNGLLRYKEGERVMKMFKDHLHLPVTKIDDSARLLAKLKGVADPEKKRKTIGAQFIEVFKEYKDDVEKKTGVRPKFLVQGTLYPDAIESCPRRARTRNTRTPSSRITTSGLAQGARVRARRAPAHALQGRGAQARIAHERAAGFHLATPVLGPRPRGEGPGRRLRRRRPRHHPRRGRDLHQRHQGRGPVR